jgi:hypothetical protein
MRKSAVIFLVIVLFGMGLASNAVWNLWNPFPLAHASSTVTVDIRLATGYNFITIPVNLVGGFTVRDLSD